MVSFNHSIDNQMSLASRTRDFSLVGIVYSVFFLCFCVERFTSWKVVNSFDLAVSNICRAATTRKLMDQEVLKQAKKNQFEINVNIDIATFWILVLGVITNVNIFQVGIAACFI